MVINSNKNEIQYEKIALYNALKKLRSLEDGSKYYKSKTSKFILTNSKTSDEISIAIEELRWLEECFILLVGNSISALESAGVSFENAEKEAIKEFEKLEALVR